jgi:hypothetical protein
MQPSQCTCGQPLFFENTRCLGCGAEVAYDPVRRRLGAVTPTGEGLWTVCGEALDPPPLFRLCAHRPAASSCNWLVPASDPAAICLSCRLTRTVPPLDRPRNAARLLHLETAKRRVVSMLQRLGLPLAPKSRDPETGLAFDFLESLPGEPAVMTGHAAGTITLNVAEADDDYREKNRESLREPYRTVIGHIRHELGHYYWDLLVRDTAWLEPFRQVFGDERADYGEALNRHYAEGPAPDWPARCISSYASAHPWEDWAETWAHYLHIRSTLETATLYRLDISQSPVRVTPFTSDAVAAVPLPPSPPEAVTAFLEWINAWIRLTAVLNETARSMGQPDTYPFVLNGPVVAKMFFVHCVVQGDRVAKTAPPPESLAV